MAAPAASALTSRGTGGSAAHAPKPRPARLRLRGRRRPSAAAEGVGGWVTEGATRVATPPSVDHAPLGWPRPLWVQATPPTLLGPGMGGARGGGWERVKRVIIMALGRITLK